MEGELLKKPTEKNCGRCHWLGGVTGKRICVKADYLLSEIGRCPGFEEHRPDWPKLVMKIDLGLLDTQDGLPQQKTSPIGTSKKPALDTFDHEALETKLLETPHLTNSKSNERNDSLGTNPTSLNIQGWTIRRNRRG